MNKIKLGFNTHKKAITYLFGIILFFALSYMGILKWGTIKIERESYITVSGSSQSQKKNEIATFNAGVTVINKDKAIAVSEVNTKSQKMVDEIKNFGISDNDVKTANMYIYQEQEAYYDGGIQKYRPGMWRATLSVEIILRDITRASDLASMLASLDTTDLNGPNFSLDTRNNNETSLLSDAIENAREKAQAMAESSGRSLGEIKNVVEGTDYNMPVFSAKADGMGGGGAPLEPGSTTVSKTVTVTFGLK